MSCNHATSGCNYPQGDCTGACMTEQGRESQRLIRKTTAATQKQYLTIVYQIHSEGQRQALLHGAAWDAARDTHAIAERDDLQTKNAELSDQCLQSVMAIATLEEQVERLVKQRDEAIEALTLMTVDQEGKEWVDSDLPQSDWDARADLGQSMARSIITKAGVAV